MTRRAAASLLPGSCSRIGSAIWRPILRTGLSECSAPWKTIEAPAQRTVRRRPHQVSTSSPLNRIWPVTFAEAGSSRRTARATDTAGARLLFRAELGAGAHTGPSGRFAQLRYEAEVSAFILDAMGLAGPGKR